MVVLGDAENLVGKSNTHKKLYTFQTLNIFPLKLVKQVTDSYSDFFNSTYKGSLVGKEGQAREIKGMLVVKEEAS